MRILRRFYAALESHKAGEAAVTDALHDRPMS